MKEENDQNQMGSNETLDLDMIVSIIGSAGRQEDAHKMSMATYMNAIKKIRFQIEREWKLQDIGTVHLQSGGASFCDHLAVTLFLTLRTLYPKLILHLPAYLCDTNGFSQNGIGSHCNKLHREFCKAMKWNEFKSLNELSSLKTNADTMIYMPQENSHPDKSAYFIRNRDVAKCNYMIALTFDSTNPLEPKSKSGTANTWKQASCPKENKAHFDLANM